MGTMRAKVFTGTNAAHQCEVANMLFATDEATNAGSIVCDPSSSPTHSFIRNGMLRSTIWAIRRLLLLMLG